ncbi:hypothetical protein LIER_29879 [Lithospermum erythrorhizon]|uniref:Uncharacterized protein n=1 Tax=Lithospermum erythrorhizon TaxID=34254 RepID=A0AAV3RP98_LITER
MTQPIKGFSSRRKAPEVGSSPSGRRIFPQRRPFRLISMIVLRLSQLAVGVLRIPSFIASGVGNREYEGPTPFPHHAATAAQALMEQGAAKEDEVDRLEAALVQENSLVYRLSLVCHELRRSTVHAQHVVEEREERVVALLAAQTTEVEVERLAKLVADLQSQRLSAGPPFSRNVAGAILKDFVLKLLGPGSELAFLVRSLQAEISDRTVGGCFPFLAPHPL